MKKNTTNLGYLGIPFQYRLVKALMEDSRLFRDLNSILDQNTFTDTNLKTFVSVMKDYYAKNDTYPSYSMILIKLNEKAISDIDLKTYSALVKKIQDTPTDGIDEIKELAIRFFKQQHIIKTANEILTIGGSGDIDKYDKCVELLTEALRKGSETNLGYKLFDDLNDTLAPDYRKTIPMGIGKVDEALHGGVGKGELALIAGSMGFGKTSFTTAVANYAATYKCDNNNNKGFKVLQIVFEDGVKAMRRKHISRITQVEAALLSDANYIDGVKESLNNFKDLDMLNNNLRIIEMPTGEKTALDIKNTLKSLINSGFKPDLMILDYFECLDMGTSSRGENEWKVEGKVMRKFENMAKEFDIAEIITTQGTKDSVASEIMTNDKIGGSVAKTQIAHIIITIARTIEQQNQQIATISITKNRHGASGCVWNNVKFDNATCTISTDEAETYTDMTEFKKKEESDRKKLQDDAIAQIQQKYS